MQCLFPSNLPSPKGGTGGKDKALKKKKQDPRPPMLSRTLIRGSGRPVVVACDRCCLPTDKSRNGVVSSDLHVAVAPGNPHAVARWHDTAYYGNIGHHPWPVRHEITVF